MTPTVVGPVTPARRQTGVVLVLVGGLLGAGVPVGVLWWLVAPTVVCTTVEGSCPYESFEGGRFFIAEGLFAVLAAASGVLAALLVRRWTREIGWPVVVALAVGGALASLAAWRVGVWLGPDDPTGLTTATGVLAEQPLRLHADGLLLVWSIASVLVALLTLLADADADADVGADVAGSRAPEPLDPAELAAWVQHAEARTQGQERSTR